MTLHIYNEIEQRSDEWYDQRRGMVTASVVGQLVTAKTLAVADNDYSRGLTALLVAERITGQTDPTYINDDMWRGIEHEPYAIEKYAEHNAVPVTSCGFMVLEEGRWKLGYSPDGLVGDDGLVEVKCPRAKGHLKTILAGEVPVVHIPQLQAGLLVTGRKWVDFISFCAGMPLFTKRVLPDPKWHEAITAAVTHFERNAAEMVGAYKKATKGLPATERAPELEVVI